MTITPPVGSITRTYKPSDWNLWTFVPQANSFVLDFSQLDGTDTLGTSIGSMTQSTAEIVNFTLTEGNQTSNGIFNDITPTTLQISIRFKDFTVADMDSFLIGQRVWLTIDNDGVTNRSLIGYQNMYFDGYIADSSTQADPESDFITMHLDCVSNTQKDLSTLVTIVRDSALEMGDQINDAAATFGIKCSLRNSMTLGGVRYHFAPGTLTRTMGDWLHNYHVAHQRLVYDKVEYNLTISDWDTKIQEISTILVDNATLTDDEITACTLGWVGADSPTAVDLTLYKDNTQYQYGTTNNNFIGSYTFSDTIDVKDTTELSGVGSTMLGINKTYGVTTLSTETATIYQPISFYSGLIYNISNIGDLITVTLDKYGISKQMLVTGRTFEVDQNNWITTYQVRNN